MGAGKPRSLITGSLLRTLGEVVPNNRTTCSEQFSELLGITGPIARNKKGKQATGSRKAGGWFYKRRLLVFAKQAAGSPCCPQGTPLPSLGCARSVRGIFPFFLEDSFVVSVGLFLFVPWSAAEYPWERTPVSAAPWFLMHSILPQLRGGLQVTNGDLLSQKIVKSNGNNRRRDKRRHVLIM